MAEKVLIAEDDEETLDVLTHIVQAEGYEVIQARNGNDAIRLVGSADIALLDRLLPDMDGLQVCDHARERSDIPIIVLSCLTTESDKVTGLNHGADDYIDKPFQPAELVARIRAHLRRFKSNRPSSPISAEKKAIEKGTTRAGDTRGAWTRSAPWMQVFILTAMGFTVISLTRMHVALYEFMNDNAVEGEMAYMSAPIPHLGIPCKVTALNPENRAFSVEHTRRSGERIERTVRLDDRTKVRLGAKAHDAFQLRKGLSIRISGLTMERDGALRVSQVTAGPSAPQSDFVQRASSQQ